MLNPKYEALRRESSESIDSETLFINKEYLKSKQQSHWLWLAVSLLGLSAILNVLAYLPVKKLQCSISKNFTIPYELNVPVTISHENRSLYDKVWEEPRYSYKPGIMAVDDTYVEKHNLPEAQRWPWDSSKSIYMLQGWHSMHCIMVLREGLIAMDQNKPSPFTFTHLTHCLHVLREDVVCYADDTPLYTGALNAETGRRVADPGTGQVRMCRDWDAIRQFGIENSACYDAIAGVVQGPEVDKYKFCPDGSEPWL